MIFNVEFWTAVMAGQPVDAQRDDRSLAALVDRHDEAVNENSLGLPEGRCRFGLPLID